VPEGERRRAGVSSFGYGGTNAHVVLESVQRPTATVVLVEAASDAALDSALEETVDRVRQQHSLDQRIIFGPCHGIGHRLAVVASTTTGLIQRLEEVRIGADGRGIFSGRAISPKQVAWVFSGQGSQWQGMGRMLVHSEPTFRSALIKCDEALAPYLGWSVLDEILGGCPRVAPHQINVMWPVLFAFQVALARLLREFGLEPAVIVGHSIGEVSAAHVAGALSLADAARIIAQQSRYVQKAVGKGVMLLAAVDWAEAEKIAENSGGQIQCAIAASPTTTVFSGEPQALAALGASLAARGVFQRAVQTGAAVHGPQMQYLEQELPPQLNGVRPKTTKIPLVSGVLGRHVSGEELDIGYWSRQLREPVHFASAIQTLLDDGIELFLEITPHAIVKQSIEESIQHAGKADRCAAFTTLWREEDEGRTIREAIAMMFVQGAHISNRKEEEREYIEGYVHLLPISGQMDLALRDSARHLASFLERNPHLPIRDVCYVSSVRRTHHRMRAVVTGRNHAEVLDGLGALAERREHSGVRVGMAPIGSRRGLVFVFPGQGSQWAGMGRTLFLQKQVFREVIEACDALVRQESGFSVIEELLADENRSQLSRIDVVQPMLFAVEIALAALWRSWGVEPDCVIGHSMGEIAAAHVAGILSLKDAVAIICRRSKLLKRVAGQGAMAAVEMSMGEAELLLEGYTDRLSVAVSNGPRTTVISGDPAALEEVLAKLDDRAIFFRRIKVDVASHSPQMDGLLGDLRAALHDVQGKPGTLKMRSTVTGQFALGPELDAAYWTKNLRDPVLFGEAVRQAISDGQSLFLEISPHPVLVHSIEDTLRDLSRDGAAIPSLRRNELERRCMVDALGVLQVYGHELAWNKLFPHGGHVLSLPTYSWQKDRYWLPDDIRSRLPTSRNNATNAFVDPDAHPLLGPALVLSIEPSLHVWENALSTSILGYLNDHRIQGEAVFPGAGYVEMALASIEELHGNLPTLLEEVSFDRMLPVTKEPDRRVQIVVQDDAPDRATFRISSREVGESTWIQHAAGRIRMGMGVPVARIARDRPRVIQARCPTVLNAQQFYAYMERGGLSYSKTFRGIETFHVGPREALARCFLHPDHFGGVDKYQVHPALLDACFQALMGIHLATVKEINGAYVLSGVDRLRIHRALGTDIWVHAELHPGDDGMNARGDVFVIDAEGRVVAEINGLGIKHLDGNRGVSTSVLDDSVYAIEWRKKDLDSEVVRSKPSAGTGAWLFFIDDGGTASSMSFLLVARGEACVRVRRGTRFARIEAGLYEIEAGNAEHYQRLLREAFGREVTCKGIVHLFALDSATWETTTPETISRDVEYGSLSVLYLVQAMARQGWRDMPRLWIVTRGAQAVLASGAPLCVSQSTLWGLGRTIALEHPEIECTRIDMDPARAADEGALLWREISARSREDQIAYRKEGRFVPRLVKSSFEAGDSAEVNGAPQPANGRPFRLECMEVGNLDSLVLRDATRRAPGLGEVEVRVEVAGLNYYDVEKALGILPTGEAHHFGMECAGRIVAVGPGVDGLSVGQEVVAFALSSLSSHVTTAAEFVVPKPSQLSFADAASIPIVFVTAYYALNKVARLGHDERILIHTATGGTGLAAIQMAQVLQAEIFATAGNEENRDLLRSLGIEHVMDSRSLSFGEELLEATAGQGVDVVLNTLTGDARARSLELLAPYGRFVELSKRDIYLNTQMPPLRRSVSFASVDLAGMAQERPALLGSLLREVIQLFEMGVFQPLPVRVFAAHELRTAFQLMVDAEHIGKVLIDMSDLNTPILPLEQKRRRIEPNATYLITGGLGGLGLSLAQWLVDQGGRHLVLTSRSQPTPVAQEAIGRMQAAGAEVLVASADVAQKEQIASVIARVEATMPPLRGVVHCAGILDDRTVLEMEAPRFLRVLEPKVAGAFHLHALTAEMPLDFFVLYSSVASLLGAPGQANYSAGNAFMDALAHSRRRLGLAGTSIHWGPFVDIGLAASQDSRGQRLSYRGLESLTPTQGLLAFSRLLDRPRAEVGIARLAVHQWVEFYPQVAGSPFWSELQREKKAIEQPSSSRVSFKQSLERRPAGERQTALELHILEHVGQVLRLDTSRIDRLSSFTNLGMDSLLSLELRNRLESSLGVRLSATLLFTYPNPASLADHLIERMSLTSSTTKRVSDTGPVATTGQPIPSERTPTRSTPEGTKTGTIQIRQMSVAEAEMLLEEELARSEDYLQ
jgi:acyl transferase domain-containing protein/NADPH:quinone reductase-like Zn-dependent oxidoreductase/acyl carrier protein